MPAATMTNDIGIPNVPWIVWDYENKRARARLDQGLCPKHGTPLVEREHDEYCPECEEDREQVD